MKKPPLLPVQPLERTRFFPGSLLTTEDFQREQDYHRNRARLHNRLLHGWGVVQGLRVSLDSGTVVVSAGLALDCVGRELILIEEKRLSLAGLVFRQWVVVRYVELSIGQIPSLSGNLEPSVIREAVTVELSAGNPLAEHDRSATGRAGCGVDHALPLATLVRRGTRWQVTAVKSGAVRYSALGSP